MNLFELCQFMKAGQFTEHEMTELPTFGGEEPTHTRGIWSWDESRMIVGDCADDFEVVWRPLNPDIESANGLTYSVFLNGYRTFSLYDLIENDHIDLAMVGEIQIDTDCNTVADVEDGVTQIVGHIKDFLTPKVVEAFIDALISEIDWGSILLVYLGNDYERLFLSWSDYEWRQILQLTIWMRFFCVSKSQPIMASPSTLSSCHSISNFYLTCGKTTETTLNPS